MKKNLFNSDIEFYENISLQKYNTYRIDSTAKYLVFPKNEEQLINVIKTCKKNNLKYFILGNGSNIILKHKHYDWVIIKLDRLNKVEYKENVVTVEAGYLLTKLAVETVAKGLKGLEFASGIPGQMGASTAMNAGAYKEELSNVIKEVRVLTPELEIKIFTNKELEFGYRDSLLKRNPGYIVLSTTIELSNGNVDEMKKDMEEKRIKRFSTQPLDKPTAGSVFRNPEGMFAGALIEESNLKGHRIGGAEVSSKHANFIINRGNATGTEIISLIKKVQKEVKKNYNVDLKLEQIIIK